MNSCATPPGSWMKHPRTVSVPVSSAMPESVIVCVEEDGMVVDVCWDWNSTPDVLCAVSGQHQYRSVQLRANV